MNTSKATQRQKAARSQRVANKRSAPVATTKQARTQGPQVHNMPRGGCRIRHREYFADLAGSTGFDVKSFPINPGLSRMFPWLSKLASRYESFRFEKLKIMFETEAPTSAKGVVALAVDYDPADAAPLSKTAALSYEGAVRSAPWASCAHTSRQLDLNKRKSYFVRCGNLPADATLSLHDVGNLFVVTKGQADSSNVGELYVEYDVVLETPQTDPSSQSAKIVGTGSVSKTAVFGTAPVVTGCLDVSVDSNTITFNQAAQTILVVHSIGTGIGAIDSSASTATVGATNGVVNAASTWSIVQYNVSAQPGETFVIDHAASTSVTSMTVRLGEYQNSLA